MSKNFKCKEICPLANSSDKRKEFRGDYRDFGIDLGDKRAKFCTATISAQVEGGRLDVTALENYQYPGVLGEVVPSKNVVGCTLARRIRERLDRGLGTSGVTEDCPYILARKVHISVSIIKD